MTSTKIKDSILNLHKTWRIVLPTLVIITMMIIVIRYLINLSTEIIVEATGRIDLDYRVFYIENESFPSNPIPQNLNFLMSFTDFIEIDNQFSARFSEEIEVYYSYRSVKRLIVRYRGSIDGKMHPIVFEIRYPLSYINNNLVSRYLSLPHPEDHASVSTYTIFPERYIEMYLDFLAEQERVMNNEHHMNRSQANFVAELQIEFIYDITIPTWNMNESVIKSYHLLLSTEVYSLVSSGYPTFSQSLDLSIPAQQVTLPIAIFFVVVFAISAYFLFTGIKSFGEDSNEFQREFSKISRKYTNEIIDLNDSLLSFFSSQSIQYTCIQLNKFESLLNLAINANEHIMCYHNVERAEFVVVKGEFVYYYEIYPLKTEFNNNHVQII